MAKESGEASAPNPPSTLGPLVTVAGNKNDAVVESNHSSNSNDNNGKKECSNNVTTKVALEDATRKNETKQASPKASNNNDTDMNTSAQPPSTPSRATVATETQKKSNNKADRIKSDTDDVAKKTETKKPSPKAAETKTPSTNQTELKTKRVPSKEAENTANTTDGYERTQKRKRTTTNSNGVDDIEMSGGIADDRTEADAKRAPPKETGNTANTTDKQKRTTTNTTGVDDSKDYSSDNSDSIGQMDFFRSSAEDTLAKALLLATRHREKKIPQTPNKNLAPTPKTSVAAEGKEQPNETQIPIEVLRDLINQHPGEFWQSIDNRVVNEPRLSKTYTTTTGGNVPTDLSKRTETMLPHKNGADNENCSENQAKRRKLECGNIDRKETPSIEDRETLAAVQVLLEASIHQLSSTGRGDDAAKGLLEQVKMLSSKAASSVSAATGGEINSSITQQHVPMDLEEGCVVRGKKEGRANNNVQDMARKVTLSFVQDLSEILRAIANARSSIGATAGKESTDENKGNRQPSKPPTKPLEPAVEDSLLCDEENLVQLKEDGDQNIDNSDDDDDEIIEISQDENYVQQHLICQETLFGESPHHKSKSFPTVKDEVDASGDILVAQKLALLRETKRLIRVKTLVLTKRRLAIQGNEDLSIVI